MTEWLNNFWGDETHRRIVVSVMVFFLTTLASFIIGRAWGNWKARREWNSKHFLGRIIVSLNSIKGGYLKIRTIFERSLDQVFINPLAVQRILTASKLTKPGLPLLPIPKEDRWFLLNFVLNAVSEEFVGSLVRYDAYDLGSGLFPFKYLLCLTCEAVGDDRIRKVRALMIRKDLLLETLPEEAKFEQPWHATRLETLKYCREAYLADPSNFLEIEIYV